MPMPVLPSAYKYWAFVSYSHTDSAWGERLHRDLETFRFPRSLVNGPSTKDHGVPARFYPVFLDRKELPTAGSLGGTINKALAASHYLIVLGSTRSAQSRWVNQEVLEFQRIGRADRIICILLDGDPRSETGADECLCPALRDEPDGAAATLLDARGLRPEAILPCLLAQLAGVTEDDLKAAQRKRQQKRAALVIGASLALVTLMAALAVSAVLGDRRTRTELAKEGQLQDFVEQIFGGINPETAMDLDKSQARALLDQGAKHLGPLQDQPIVQAELQAMVGECYETIGLFKEASFHEQISYDLRRKILGPEHPDTLGIMQALGVALSNLGKYSEAEALDQKAIEIESRLLGPEDIATITVTQNLAANLTGEGRFPDAEKLDRKSLESKPTCSGPSIRKHFSPRKTWRWSWPTRASIPRRRSWAARRWRSRPASSAPSIQIPP